MKILFCLLFLVASYAQAETLPVGLSEEDTLNFDCLKEFYPMIDTLEEDASGLWLLFTNGRRVLYAGTGAKSEVDVRQSMEEPYMLEPTRPKTPPGYAPGRKRSYALLKALYGDSKAQVSQQLVTVKALGQTWRFSPAAAKAFLRAAAKLEGKKELASWLVSCGSFMWRKIAGEARLSPHSFGIAFDIGVDRGATYWQWSSLRPHPFQKSYPAEIVAAFEEAGFIWGGKWHEYDLMHFEYRPELICKARKRQGAWRATPQAHLPLSELAVHSGARHCRSE
ncbi:MAG: M15 family metallopeptidase [Desulfovibrionaceae bacterium]|nr:M15 family metallopeptidase [Desulfovibrionaceae bacterium]